MRRSLIEQLVEARPTVKVRAKVYPDGIRRKDRIRLVAPAPTGCKCAVVVARLRAAN